MTSATGDGSRWAILVRSGGGVAVLGEKGDAEGDSESGDGDPEVLRERLDILSVGLMLVHHRIWM